MDNKENVKNVTFIVLEGINSEETYKMEDSLETESVAENSAGNISENGKAYKCKHCEKLKVLGTLIQFMNFLIIIVLLVLTNIIQNKILSTIFSIVILNLQII